MLLFDVSGHDDGLGPSFRLSVYVEAVDRSLGSTVTGR
jgi:hypothetical protein